MYHIYFEVYAAHPTLWIINSSYHTLVMVNKYPALFHDYKLVLYHTQSNPIFLITSKMYKVWQSNFPNHTIWYLHVKYHTFVLLYSLYHSQIHIIFAKSPQQKTTGKISHLIYSNIQMHHLIQQVNHNQLPFPPAPFTCVIFAAFGFKTGATKPSTAILAATSLPNL